MQRVSMMVCLGLLSLVGWGCGAAPSKAPVSANSDNETASETRTVSQQIVMEVPSMSCPVGCYPTVKRTLEGQEGVASVELVAQPNPDEISDRRVTLKLDGSFDADKAVEALAQAGFEGAAVRTE